LHYRNNLTYLRAVYLITEYTTDQATKLTHYALCKCPKIERSSTTRALRILPILYQIINSNV